MASLSTSEASDRAQALSLVPETTRSSKPDPNPGANESSPPTTFLQPPLSKAYLNSPSGDSIASSAANESTSGPEVDYSRSGSDDSLGLVTSGGGDAVGERERGPSERNGFDHDADPGADEEDEGEHEADDDNDASMAMTDLGSILEPENEFVVRQAEKVGRAGSILRRTASGDISADGAPRMKSAASAVDKETVTGETKEGGAQDAYDSGESTQGQGTSDRQGEHKRSRKGKDRERDKERDKDRKTRPTRDSSLRKDSDRHRMGSLGSEKDRSVRRIPSYASGHTLAGPHSAVTPNAVIADPSPSSPSRHRSQRTTSGAQEGASPGPSHNVSRHASKSARGSDGKSHVEGFAQRSASQSKQGHAGPSESPYLAHPHRPNHGDGQGVVPSAPSSRHLRAPNLPSAQVKAAPSSGMYWSLAPVHGRLPSKCLRAHSATLVGDTIWVFGGCDERGCFRDVWRLDAETLSWSKPKVSGDIPPPLRAHSAIAFDKRIFIFGGGEGPSYYNDLYYFDTVSHIWTKPPIFGTIPSARRAHTAVLHGSNMLIFGGGNGSRALNDLHTLDLSNVTALEWKEVETKGPKPISRGYHTMNLIADGSGAGSTGENGGKVIVMGGSDGTECFDDVWVLDLETRAWQEVPVSSPLTRLSHTSTQVGSYLFIMGGHDGKEYQNEVVLFDLVSYQFERRAIFGQAPPRCGYHSVTLQDSRLLMLGGFDGSHVFGEAWRLDLASWAYLPQVMTFEIGSAASIRGED